MEKNNARQYNVGMKIDQHQSVQPEGSYRSALNIINNDESNDKPFRAREKGSKLCIELKDGYKLKGHFYVNNNEVMALLSDEKYFKIIKVKPNCENENILESDCMSIKNFVDMTYRIRNGCEDVIYFTDCDNPVMTINLSQLDQYKIDGKYDCSLFELFRPYNIPCVISGEVISSGGFVRYGSYNIAIQYLDKDLNPTNSMYASSIITVSDSNSGAFNFDVNQEAGKKVSGKSIKWVLSDLDSRFPYYRVIVIEASTGTGNPFKYYASKEIRINHNTFIYDGRLDGYTEVTLGEVLTQNISFRKASFIDQLEDRLVLLGLKNNDYNYCEWQKFASKIKAEWTLEEITTEDYINKGYKGEWLNTFMADEVIPCGIVYVDKRGGHHPVFHIPGSPLNMDIDCKEVHEYPCVDYTYYLLLNITRNSYKDINVDAEIEWSFSLNGKKITRNVNFTKFIKKEDSNNGPFIVDTIDVCNTDKFVVSSKRTAKYNNTDYYVVLSSRTDKNIFGKRPSKQALTGHDDTVYPEWDKDMEHLLSEKQYKEYIDVYNSTTNDKVIYGDGSLENLKRLKKVNGLPRRWQIYNTATRRGRLSYYQCLNSFYDNPLSVCCDDYWGEDYCGNKLKDTPIRHIKMPDRTLIPLFGNGKLRRLGLKFSNIEYPHSDIIGHYIVYAKQDKYNRTIIDKGILNPSARHNVAPFGRFIEGFSYWSRDESPDLNNYISPALLLGEESLSGINVKLENEYTFHQHFLRSIHFEKDGIKGVTDTEIEIISRNYIQNGTDNPLFTNGLINDQYTLDPLNVYEKSNRAVSNMSLTTKVGFIELNRPLVKNKGQFEGDLILLSGPKAVQWPYRVEYVSIKNNIDVHSSLDTIEYLRLHDCVKKGDTTVFGNTYMTRMDFCSESLLETYSTLKHVFSAWLGGILFAGLVYDNLYEDDGFNRLTYDKDLDDITRITVGLGNLVSFAGELISVWVESDYNWFLRSNGYDKDTDVYRFSGIINREDSALLNHFTSHLTVKNGNYFEPREAPAPEFYLYNKDYSRINNESKYIGLPITYEFCSECLENNPNRAAYSEKSFLGEKTDNYRIFKANNFLDIPLEKGLATDLLRDGTSMYVHTTDGMWLIPYGYQETVRNNIVTYIGDGAFFSQPARLLIDADLGSAGSLNRQSTVKTPGGIFFIDELSSKPMIISSGKLMDISGDYSSWFNKWLKTFLVNELEIEIHQGVVYNIAAYDELNNRVVFTKIDYSLKKDKSKYKYIDRKFYYNGLEIKIEDENYFINRSFTISIDIGSKEWISFHSYIPEYYIYNKDTIMYFLKSKLWALNSDQYNNYHGIQFPCIIDLHISSGQEDKIFEDLLIQVHTRKKINGSDVATRDFFNSVIIYNSWQSTGELKINIKKSFDEEEKGIILADSRDIDWFLNQFRDLVIDSSLPIFIEDREYYSIKDGFVDKKNNDAAIDINKNWTDQQPFRDKWIAARFIIEDSREIQFIIKTVLNTENIIEI